MPFISLGAVLAHSGVSSGITEGGGTPPDSVHQAPLCTELATVFRVSTFLRTAHSQAAFLWCQVQGGKLRTDFSPGTNTVDACSPEMVICEVTCIPSLGHQWSKSSNTEAARQPSRCHSSITFCRKPFLIPLSCKESRSSLGFTILVYLHNIPMSIRVFVPN